MKRLHPQYVTGLMFLALMGAAGFFAARTFEEMRQPDVVIAGPGVTRVGSLADYHQPLRGTHGDTPVYYLESGNPGPTILVLGGVHPNEPAGFLAAVVLVENAVTKAGRIIIIPQASLSGFTCTDPLEGSPQHYDILTRNGTRRFRYGARGMNPLDQWPDPLVYLHYPSGQRLSGIETRNLNRSYPGRADGTFTEQVAYAIMRLIRVEHVALAFDLHEAAPEYPVINAIVTHEKGEEIAAAAMLDLELEDLDYTLELSPKRFRGLSHREWGDSTGAIPFLMETGNIMQGRLHGRSSPELILTGKDEMYLKAAAIGLVRIPYDSAGVPIRVRVGRHLAGIRALLDAFNAKFPERQAIVDNIPTYSDLEEHDLGYYLR